MKKNIGIVMLIFTSGFLASEFIHRLKQPTLAGNLHVLEDDSYLNLNIPLKEVAKNNTILLKVKTKK